MDHNEPKYNITMSEHLEPDYRDGFADGFSRGWTECWEYMREEILTKCQKDDQDKSQPCVAHAMENCEVCK